MTDFEIKDVEKYYKIVENKLVDMVTSDVIYTINDQRSVICHTFFCINDVNYFMIHSYNRCHDICDRVIINLNSRQIHTKNDATVYLQSPIVACEDGNFAFNGGWVIDDLKNGFKVKFTQDGGVEILESILNGDDSDEN